MTNEQKIHVALPVLNEFANLPILIDALKAQEDQGFHLWVCVNNYEELEHDVNYLETLLDNLKSLRWLEQQTDISITIIDRSSTGRGWAKGKGGVGWARKLTMDAIAEVASDKDIIVSMDADTRYPKNYLAEIRKSFAMHSQAMGLTIPYYHQLANDDTDRLILRYEIYMRHYLNQMIRIGNPYAFSAIGSAMACPVWAYRKVGGLTPVISGEDFYFIQKLSKSGSIINWCDTVAYPSPRFSSRVVFGTGPALIKGNRGDWSPYPVYHPDLFNQIRATFSAFPGLYKHNIEMPLEGFLLQKFKDQKWFEPLRKNYKSECQFVKACVNKVDGLRILQYLREMQSLNHFVDEEVLTMTYAEQWPELFGAEELADEKMWNYHSIQLDWLNDFRNALFYEENRLRQQQLINSL